MSVQASYLEQGTGARDAMDWNPEFSRRARGVGVYATLRSLGRQGVVDLVERSVRLAQRFAHALAASGRAEVVNEVVSNQVLVRWLAPDGDNAGLADRVMAGVRERGHRLLQRDDLPGRTPDADIGFGLGDRRGRRRPGRGGAAAPCRSGADGAVALTAD